MKQGTACTTCGVRKPPHAFPLDPEGHGGLMTCHACLARTAKLEARAEKARRVAPDAAALPPEPIQLALRRRLEASTKRDLARELRCTPGLINKLLAARGKLPLPDADRWAVRLDSHLDVLYEAG